MSNNVLKQMCLALQQSKLNYSDILIKEDEQFKYRLPNGYQLYHDTPMMARDNLLEFLAEMGKNPDTIDQQVADNGGHLDFSLTVEDVRYRCNLFAFGGNARLGMSLRKLNDEIPLLENLMLPRLAKSFADRATGLVLCTGPTGSGKSTTLASMIDHINASRPGHIITIEDPIEYLHRNKKASITQREIGSDVSTFAHGLKASLREDPDVILIGEIRDRETCEAALMAAETGHLVLSTLHTTSAPKTVERLMDFFQGEEKMAMQSVISSVLTGVISQVLAPSMDGKSRILITEVMGNTPPIASAIRTSKLQQIPNEMHTGFKDGQQLMNRELTRLVVEGHLEKDTARMYAYDHIGLETELKNARTSGLAPSVER